MSSRNCDWKTASRSTRRIKAELPSQLLQRQPPPLALTSLTERCHQPLRISWRTEQVRGLHQSSQFIGGNQGNILCATTANNHHFVIIGNLVQHGGQALAQAGIGGLDWHKLLNLLRFSVQYSCTVAQISTPPLLHPCSLRLCQGTTFSRAKQGVVKGTGFSPGAKQASQWLKPIRR